MSDADLHDTLKVIANDVAEEARKLIAAYESSADKSAAAQEIAAKLQTLQTLDAATADQRFRKPIDYSVYNKL